MSLSKGTQHKHVRVRCPSSHSVIPTPMYAITTLTCALPVDHSDGIQNQHFIDIDKDVTRTAEGKNTFAATATGRASLKRILKVPLSFWAWV